MKLAIMQPYFLPYIGYWQLLAAADKFVVLDDVHFINRGWINRNRMLVNGQAHLFTLPLKGASQNRLICELELDGSPGWRRKLLATLQQNYRKAPHFAECHALIEQVIRHPVNGLAEYLLNSLRGVCEYLGLTTELVPTSRCYANCQLKGAERIQDICRREGATTYLNPPGGRELYDRDRFAAAGIALHFVQPEEVAYQQMGGSFVPWLSVLDVLMFNSREQVQGLLRRFKLDPPDTSTP